MSNIRLAINGADGRMGEELQALLRDDARFELVGRVGASDKWRDAPKLDVVVDFSTPDGLAAALDHCESHGIALVSGTTGLDESLRRRIDVAAKGIALLHAANFSLGIAVLTRALCDAAKALPDWDLEILEAHHARKTDAPSGTALALGRAAAEARGQDFDEVAVRARNGQPGPRPAGAIGFASLRASDIVGEHTALLVGEGERLELSHRATDRKIFASGALTAAAWLAGKPAGTYSLDDVLREPL
ncbi:MAG: 4-hydroxy-tetrahydrodipicolinate reductase [Rhodanobacteraceae bacterium]